jgi:hypothetical protein
MKAERYAKKYRVKRLAPSYFRDANPVPPLWATEKA